MNIDDIKADKKPFKKIECEPRNFDEIKDKIVIEPEVKDYRLVVLADLHSPYLNGEILNKIVKLEQQQTHLPPIHAFVLAGDVGQWDEFSYFRRNKKSLIRKTVLQSRYIIRHLARLAKVYVMMGNHDLRIEKQLLDKFDADVAIDMNQILRLSDRLVYGIRNVDVIQYFMLKFDDAVIAHFDIASVIHARTATWAYDFVDNLERYGELKGKKVRCVAQAHNHRCNPGTIYKLVLCIETGCLCENMDYALMKTSHHSRRELFQHGYARLVFKDNKIDMTESRAIPLI